MDDASSLAGAVRRREVRAADALDASLDAIQQSELNTVVTLDAEGARRQAEVIDERLSRGEDPGLFARVPLPGEDRADVARGAAGPGPGRVGSWSATGVARGWVSWPIPRRSCTASRGIPGTLSAHPPARRAGPRPRSPGGPAPSRPGGEGGAPRAPP